MPKTRLHWFWRGMIAMVLGVVLPAWLMGAIWLGGISHFLVSIENAILRGVGQIGSPPTIFWAVKRLIIILPCALTTLVAYGLLTRYVSPTHQDRETRCRKCG